MAPENACIGCSRSFEEVDKISIFDRDKQVNKCYAYKIHQITGQDLMFGEDKFYICQNCKEIIVQIYALEQMYKDAKNDENSSQMDETKFEPGDVTQVMISELQEVEFGNQSAQIWTDDIDTIDEKTEDIQKYLICKMCDKNFPKNRGFNYRRHMRNSHGVIEEANRKNSSKKNKDVTNDDPFDLLKPEVSEDEEEFTTPEKNIDPKLFEQHEKQIIDSPNSDHHISERETEEKANDNNSSALNTQKLEDIKTENINKNVLSCNACFRTFPSSRGFNFRRHRRKAHGIFEKPEEIEKEFDPEGKTKIEDEQKLDKGKDKINEVNNNGLSCRVCSKSFNRHFNYRRHMANAHGILEKPKERSLKKKEKQMENSFNCKQELDAIVEQDENSFEIDVRKQSADSSKTIINSENGLSCPVCFKTYPSSRRFNLKRHMNNKHSIELEESKKSIKREGSEKLPDKIYLAPKCITDLSVPKTLAIVM